MVQTPSGAQRAARITVCSTLCVGLSRWSGLVLTAVERTDQATRSVATGRRHDPLILTAPGDHL